ncbi:MAG: TetR family transcriptional regulator, partial [Oscillospiraceae bacterium]|nr:TetR family transcriptional regulator [Oscillospiraceae bacterium]
MGRKEDLRVKKTKKALAESFMALMSEKPFDQITVNELCDRSSIRRATFYKHYTDKFDYLAAFTRMLRDNFDSYIWKSAKPDATAAYHIAYVKGVLDFIEKNESIINNLLGSGLFPSVSAIIMEENYKDTEARLRASVAAGMKLHV